MEADHQEGKHESKHLEVDAYTLSDLEIFDSGTDAPSLFDFCNETRSDGGARALRRRMTQPWCHREQILATQEAIRFILDHRDVFEGLPSTYLMNRADHYRHEILPMIEARGSLEFGLSAVSLWANQRSHEADDSGERLRFDYTLKAGVSSQRLGMRVLQQEGVFDLLDGGS